MSGVININTSGTGNTTIGNILSITNISGNSINMNGSVNINTIGTSNTNIGNIGTIVNISSKIINICSENLPALGSVNIATGLNNGAGSFAQFGHNSLSALYLRAGTMFINDNANSGSICIGSSGTTFIYANVALGANALTDPTAQSTNITLGTAYSLFRLYTPIIPLYGYPVGSSSIGAIVNGTLSTGYTSPGGLGAIVYVSTSGVWNFSWNIQFVAYYITYVRPDFRIPGVTSFNVQCSVMYGQSNYWFMSGSYTSHVTSGTNGYGAIYMNFDTNPSGYSIVDIYGNIRAVRIA